MISMRKKCSSTVVGLVLLRLSITCGLQNSKLNRTKRFSLPSIKCSAAPPRLRLLRLLPSARKWNRWAQFRQWNIAEELGTMSKNNFCRITLVRRPVWRIHSLTLIISCHKVSQWESICQYAEEAGQPSRDNFLPIRFFAQHADGGLRKSSKSESSGSNFWFSVVCV